MKCKRLQARLKLMSTSAIDALGKQKIWTELIIQEVNKRKSWQVVRRQPIQTSSLCLHLGVKIQQL